MKLRTIEILVWVNIPTRKTIIMEINQKSEENQKKFIFLNFLFELDLLQFYGKYL